MKNDFNKANIDERRNMFENIKNVDIDDKNYFNIIILLSMLQKEDGTFDLVERDDAPSDVIVYYCDEPTYICTSLYIKTLVNDEKWFINNIGIERLEKALDVCFKNKLFGHGYNGLETQIKIMELFLINKLKDFMKEYSYVNYDFNNMIEEIINSYKERMKDNNFTFGFENYESEIKKVVDFYEK